MDKITLIGTSHISKESVTEIKQFISENKPDIVALELDLQRANALLHEQKNKINLLLIRQIGVKGYIFAKVGQTIQQKLGKMVKMSPGSEMKTALKLAHQNKLQIALIDQPIQITLKNFSKSLTWKEKFRFLGDIFKSIFFPKRAISELGIQNLDLSKVPKSEVIEKLIGQLKKRYPSIHKSLVADRNRYMVKQLIKIKKSYPEKEVLAIVGAGHKKEMQKMLNKVDIVKKA